MQSHGKNQGGGGRHLEFGSNLTLLSPMLLFNGLLDLFIDQASNQSLMNAARNFHLGEGR